MMASEPHAPQPADPFEGTVYRVVRQLGAGGMGEVFLLQHLEIGKLLVGKVIHAGLSGDARALERMRIEAQGLGALRHPHIVKIFGFDRLRDGRPFILMEHLKGRTLREELVARGRLPVHEALGYACQLLEALGATHAIDIVHRDIKPDNLFLCARGDQPCLKVLDFGVARVTAASPIKPLPAGLMTETGQVIGSLAFQSPEGARGEHVDARADLYAVALVLYLMLAGRGPFDHLQSSMLLSAHVQETPEPPSRYAVAPIPGELDAAILRALSKAPGERFQSAAEFRTVLAGIAASLGQPASWSETRTVDVEAAEADIGAAFPGASPAQGEPPGGPGLARRWHLVLFVATALITAALATAAALALRGWQ